MNQFEPHQFRTALANLLSAQQSLLATLDARIQDERAALK